MIPLHIPYYRTTRLSDIEKILNANDKQKLSNNLSQFFKTEFSFPFTAFTKSCTNALEVAAILTNVGKGDEVILPAYTFVSSANAFALRGANLKFADSRFDHPNVDVKSILDLANQKTKAIVIVHYGGVCINEIETLVKFCKANNIFLIEDNAHSIGSTYKNKFLGTFGDASTISFHESKNLTCIEGGSLTINNKLWIKRSDHILNKGTNRTGFDNRKKKFYEWVDLGSDFKMDHLHLSILTEQIQFYKEINSKRLELYSIYSKGLDYLKSKGDIMYNLPSVDCCHNAHNFWFTVKNEKTRELLTRFMMKKGIYSTFHYLALNKTVFGKKYSIKKNPINAIHFEKTLLRIPLYYQLKRTNAKKVIDSIELFFKK